MPDHSPEGEFPISVVVAGALYSIEYVASWQEVDADCQDPSFWGQADHRNRVIRVCVRNRLGVTGILEAVLHEVLHAIFVQQPALRECLRRDQSEERLISTLGAVLADTFVRSGWIEWQFPQSLTARILPDSTEAPDA